MWYNPIRHKLGQIKDWHIKALWIDCLMLKLIKWGFSILGWCLPSDCVWYIGHRIYTVIVWRWSCSPSSLSAAVQLLSFVILSCLTHKQTHTHTTATKWLKWCLLKWHCDPRDVVCSFQAEANNFIRWFIHVSQLHESDRDIFILCLSSPWPFVPAFIPNAKTDMFGCVFNHACVRHVPWFIILNHSFLHL